ncbi:hypothetical protein N656DRAFT_92979 [Canariomyces notabilis]|uniref:Rieske domain-containing protein n=1 Tax=Canariomyces notabilis TaxID=2074819 RepID=A0AAN6TDP1_9PEZI|nr:hypothetical protein N656DRAFT_92979 [Canariomyces arenarius]
MTSFLNPFRARTHPGTEWFSVGLASSFPDVGSDESQPQLCGNQGADGKPGCKVFHVPQTDVSQRAEVEIPAEEGTQDLTDQVLVFQYRGKFHAVDHQCPHSSYPLSRGIPFDIEDFGIVLSAGLTCPKHNWSFDLFSGRSDRGNYKLKIWEVQLRDVDGTEPREQKVWVRRKPRIG